MTEKQENILQAALKLFASEGYHATSTNKVAKSAGVSEGLIFRHFGNKEGLLDAVLNLGKEKFKAIYANIIFEENPKQVIKGALSMLFNVPEEDYTFWKLQMKLKWEMDVVNIEKILPLKMALEEAFKKLGYAEPVMEAAVVLHIIDGISSAVLMGQPIDKEKLESFLIKKYDL